jgi:hypothetical protein
MLLRSNAILMNVQVAVMRQELTLKENQYEEQLKAERQLSAEQLRREKDKCTAEIAAQLSQVSTAHRSYRLRMWRKQRSASIRQR